MQVENLEVYIYDLPKILYFYLNFLDIFSYAMSISELCMSRPWVKTFANKTGNAKFVFNTLWTTNRWSSFSLKFLRKFAKCRYNYIGENYRLFETFVKLLIPNDIGECVSLSNPVMANPHQLKSQIFVVMLRAKMADLTDRGVVSLISTIPTDLVKRKFIFDLMSIFLIFSNS